MTNVRLGFGVLLLVLVWSSPGFTAVLDSPPDTQVAPPGDDTLKQAVPPSLRPDMRVNRGELLYENHCQGCHQSTVHIRSQRRADSLESLQAWVRRWAEDRELGWDEEAIRAVVDFLNLRYYRIGLPKDNK
jgi:cytochrome c5